MIKMINLNSYGDNFNKKRELWDFRDENGSYLAPLVYSDNRTQEDIINEILDLFDNGENLIFLKAQVGTGKSAIALSLINYLGKGIVSVPVKSLQDQYYESYLKRFKIGNLDVSMMKGKGNFNCVFEEGKKCSNSKLPCNRKLKNKETRWNIATQCKDWNPVLISYTYDKIKRGLIIEPDSYYYQAVDGEYVYVKRDSGCEYFNQYESYIKNNIAIVMNSQKWIIETLLGRKPITDIEIIDEADAFLDDLSQSININHSVLNYIELAERKKFKNIKTLHKMIDSSNIDLFDFIQKLSSVLEDCDSEYALNLSSKLMLMMLSLEDIKLHRNINPYTNEPNLQLILARPDKILEGLLNKSSSRILLMSATIHSNSILNEMFNKKITIITGETKFPGTLKIVRTGRELIINNENWNEINFKYWRVLNDLIELSKKPALCNIFSYRYLPSRPYKNILSSEDVRENQDKYIKEFKKGKRDVLFTTKYDRGLSLDNEKARSLILTKLPFPDLSDPILTEIKTNYGPRLYKKYLNNMVIRETIQNIGRVLRNNNDWSYVYSPDLKLLRLIPRIWGGNIEFINIDDKN